MTAVLATPDGRLAEIDRQIAAIKAHLDQAGAEFTGGDDESLWPLRRELVALHNERQHLLNQLPKGGKSR